MPALVLASWIFTVTAIDGTQAVTVGPYKTVGGCRDWLGSALYLHPFKCHLHPTEHNCRIIGNGYAYPEGWPYPSPVTLPSIDCTESSDPVAPNGFGYFSYSPSGVHIEGGKWGKYGCGRRRKTAAMRGAVVGSGCFFQGNY